MSDLRAANWIKGICFRDGDFIDRCPTCKEFQFYNCKCSAYHKICKNGHEWHYYPDTYEKIIGNSVNCHYSKYRYVVPLPICPLCHDTKYVEDYPYNETKMRPIKVAHWTCTECNVVWEGTILDDNLYSSTK